MNRRGVASVWALVVLAVTSMMTAAIVGHFVAARRSLETTQRRSQAERIAEAAKEIALAKLSKSKDYTGETLKLLINGEAVVAVSVGELPETLRVVVESQFPTNQPRAVKTRIAFLVRRSGDRVEIVE